MTSALLDPWLATVPKNPDDRFAKSKALSVFAVKVRSANPVVDVAGFLETVELAALQRWCYEELKPGRGFANWFFPLLKKLARQTTGGAAAAVTGGPPDLTRSWLQVLSELTTPADATSWRTPVCFVPKARDDVWPQTAYATVSAHGTETERLLVRIEAADDHADFKHCVDPWLYRAPVAPEGLDDAETRRLPRLPRPALLLRTLAIDEWSRTLAEIAVAYPKAKDDIYPYVPPDRWQPHAMSRDDWQASVGCFPVDSKTTIKGEKKGPVDRNGAVWSWDIEERHWDVQHPDKRLLAAYANVSTDGRVLSVRD